MSDCERLAGALCEDAGLTTTFASSYTAQVSLPGALSLEAIADYGRQATGAKYVIIPSRAA